MPARAAALVLCLSALTACAEEEAEAEGSLTMTGFGIPWFVLGPIVLGVVLVIQRMRRGK